MNNEKEWHELRRKVMYSEDIDEEANHWKEIDRRLKHREEIIETARAIFRMYQPNGLKLEKLRKVIFKETN